MYWCLVSRCFVSRGVVSGLCLTFAKYCYDKIEKKKAFHAACRNGTAGSLSENVEHRRALASAIFALAAPSSLKVEAAAEAVALSEEKADAGAGGYKADDFHPTAVEALLLKATNTATAAPDSQSTVTTAIVKPQRGTTPERVNDDQRVEEALASGDLSSMNTLLDDICDPVLRHSLMNRLVNGYYRLRSDSKYRAAFYRTAYLQIEEIPSILEGIEEIGRPRPNHIDAFKSMAIALDEDGHQEAAIAVCNIALSLGLQDGTKTGFEGRINRLKKIQLRDDVPCPEQLFH